MYSILLLISVFLIAETTVCAQTIIRSSLSSFGNSTLENGIIYRQTIGQPSNVSSVSNNSTFLRQGFQQPASSLNFNSSKEKVCTMYLSPNPTSDVVLIKFLEEIGENQITVFDMVGKLQLKVNTHVSVFQMDVSKFPRGVYLLNVVSKSGYHCNEKLIVL